MNDLIEKLEKAGEGSRELDEEIAQAVFPKLVRRHASWYIDDMRTDIEPFSTSLDAALMLVPEYLKEGVQIIIWGWCAIYENYGGVGRGWRGEVRKGKNKAERSLCIAALKAREIEI